MILPTTSELADLEQMLRASPKNESLRKKVRTLYSSGQRSGQYQPRDWNLVDYAMHHHPEIPFPLRGPAPTHIIPGEYIVCLGSAAAFGALCEHPYPHILSERLGLPMLNLGHAGGSPEFYLKSGIDKYLHLINSAASVVVEVMSSRSTSSNLYASVDGRRMVKPRNDPSAQPAPMEEIVRRLARAHENETLEGIVRSAQVNYVTAFRCLLDKITPRKVLLYFSKSELGHWTLPSFLQTGDETALNTFPQMVESWMVDAIRVSADAYVQVATTRGLPTHAIDRFSGEEILYPFSGRSTQAYYPSTEMHADAAEALMGALQCE